MQVKLRCYAVSEGRQAILNDDGEETGRTKVVSLTVSLWDHDIPKDVHCDRRFTATLTTMNPAEFGQFAVGNVYTIDINAA